MSYKFTFQLTLSLKEGDYTLVKDHDEDCSICLEREGREWAKLECGHYFHKKCLVEYLRLSDQKRCPLCRADINKEESCVVS